MHISFVILHYVAIKDTIKCVESIINNISYTDYSIILVDNASPNNTGEELVNKYKNEEKIIVIKNNENLGFAKGNNVGFRYAKYEKKADFIVMINNDTVIEQKNFCEKLIDVYKKEDYYVLGPDIISLCDGGHQNPFKMKFSSEREVKKRILVTGIKLILSYIGLESIIRKVFKIDNSPNIRTEKIDHNIYEGVLHGSCLIFSKNYIKKYDGLYDKTFMYGEEEILFHMCKINCMKYLYSPEITIYHNESSSTKEDFSNKKYKQKIFLYKSKLNSYIKFYRILNGKEKV